MCAPYCRSSVGVPAVHSATVSCIECSGFFPLSMLCTQLSSECSKSVSWTNGAMPGNVETKQCSLGYRASCRGKCTSTCIYLRVVSDKQSLLYIRVYNLPFLFRAANVSFVSKHRLCVCVCLIQAQRLFWARDR